MFTVYILYSPTIDRYYVGQTEDFDTRFKLHLDKFFVGNFTGRALDWEVFHKIDCNSRTQALQIELHIKRMKSRKYIQNLKIYSDMSEKLKDSYKNQ